MKRLACIRFYCTALVAIGLVGVLSAATFVLTTAPSSLDDWKNGSFYEGGVAPTGVSTDTIATKFVNKNTWMTIELDGTNENGEDNATFKFLGGMRGIILSNAVLKVTVPAGDVATLNCAVWDNSSRSGTIEKYGDGELYLASRLKVSTTSTSPADFESHLHVFDGTVRLTENAELGHQYHTFHSITIEQPAKVITLFNDCVWQVRGLYGEGMITNEASSACKIYVTPGPYKQGDGGEFLGVIGGNVSVEARGCRLALSGTSNTMSGGVSSVKPDDYDTSPEVHVRKIGNKVDAASSMGNGTVILVLNIYPFVYDGLGETTDRDFQLNYRNSIFSGGTNGNLVYKGILRRWDATTRNPGLFLTGDNLHPCTFAPYGIDTSSTFGEFKRTVDSETEWFNYYFGKRGTGEWHFPLTGRFRNTGVFAIENGILSFESIDRAGELTPLGYSTRLFDNKEITHPSREPQVDYAFLLGSDNLEDVGLMECTTNLARQCTDRPFGLKGKGGFRANKGLVKYANVFGVGSGEKTLVLDGTNTLGSEVHDIADHKSGSGDTAVVSVEKNGPGTWVLGGDQAFTGSLTVNGGTLIVRRPAQKYQRYRLMVLETANKNTDFGGDPSNTGSLFHLSEIGLYASDNTRQNLNLKYNPAYAALRPGECALGVNRLFGNMGANLLLGTCNVYELLFDGYRARYDANGTKLWHALSGYGFYSEDGSIAWISPVYGKPTTYLPFDMYLADDAQPIDHFDILSSSGDNKYVPSRVQLLASVDGVHWDEVSEICMINGIVNGNNDYWLSNGDNGLVDGANPTVVKTSETRLAGWKTTKTAPTKIFSLLEGVGPVTVGNGATLKYEGDAAGAPTLSHVTLAAGATGSIDGFAFGENGTFEIDAMNDNVVSVAVTLPNAHGLDNVASWSVKVGGVTKSRYRVTARANGFTLSKGGITVIFR